MTPLKGPRQPYAKVGGGPVTGPPPLRLVDRNLSWHHQIGTTAFRGVDIHNSEPPDQSWSDRRPKIDSGRSVSVSKALRGSKHNHNTIRTWFTVAWGCGAPVCLFGVDSALSFSLSSIDQTLMHRIREKKGIAPICLLFPGLTSDVEHPI